MEVPLLHRLTHSLIRRIFVNLPSTMPHSAQRLRQARLARGWSLADLSERLELLGTSITRAGLSKYEHEKSRPPASMLLRLARALEVRPSFLLGETGPAIQWIGYRKHAHLSKRTTESIQARAEMRIERQLWLEEALGAAPRGGLPPAKEVRNFAQAEEQAEILRRRWHLDGAPVPRLVERAEDEGARIVALEPVESFDGLSGWAGPRVPVIVLNEAMPPDRLRLNLAHEIGHLVCAFPGATPKHEEAFAFRFAAAFLVPAAAARAELGERRDHLSIEELARLKRKYGFSMQAWMRRARDLEIIGEGTYVDLNRKFRTRGWHREEPVACTESEQPQRLQLMALRALAEGVVGEDWVRETCPEALRSTLDAPAATGRPADARELLRLPRTRRQEALETAATHATEAYASDADLIALHSLEGEDFHDEPEAR
jgi:Zn-dependent peptidase ImmA (M78 family)